MSALGRNVQDAKVRGPKQLKCSAKAVLLDAAGTLIRLREPVGETYAAVAARFGLEIDPLKLSQAFDMVFGDMPALAFEWTSPEELHRQERDWWRTFVRRVIGLTGSRVHDFDAFFETLYRHYTQGQAWECFPDVPLALKSLRVQGYKLAVVSNADSRLLGVLEELGIKDLMDAVIYSSEFGSAKPDPSIFKQALIMLGVSAERAIHVGDSPRADVEGSQAAGIAGLLIARDCAPSAAVGSVIGSLDELLVRLGHSVIGGLS